jgi:regulator of cell morphogenesis and NO signaling
MRHALPCSGGMRMEQTLQRRTIGELVAERPMRSHIFEQLGIDYCCGGKRSLDQACRERGLDAATVLRMMQAFDHVDHVAYEVDWRHESLTRLCDHIQRTHHDYLRGELPALGALIHKVAAAHGAKHPELARVAEIFDGFQNELTAHMKREEYVLFPYIRTLESMHAPRDIDCCALNQPIHVMELEHEKAGVALVAMRALLNGYAIPDGVCNSYRAMLERMKALEENMHVHVHKENSILFPRAIAAERRKMEGLGGWAPRL